MTGNVTADEALAIARAVHARPADFGIDRHGIPSILAGDLAQPTPDGWRCVSAVTFVGGPRAAVVVGIRQDPAGNWQVTSRVTRQALHQSAPRPPDQC